MLFNYKLIIVKLKINATVTNHEGIHKNLFQPIITFSYVKKIFRSEVSLHYENTLFIFFFHLEGKVPIKTGLKSQ